MPEEEWVRSFIDGQRIARLATVDELNRPHIVPVVFAYDGRQLYTPIDAKPKRVDASRLRRVQNIRSNPHVAVLLDHYDEDWSRLAWVQLHGTAEYYESGPETGARLLVERYLQYAPGALTGRPLIVIAIERILSWRASG